jgi:hypothetical protein
MGSRQKSGGDQGLSTPWFTARYRIHPIPFSWGTGEKYFSSKKSCSVYPQFNMRSIFGRSRWFMQKTLHFALFGLGLLCAAALLGGCTSIVLFNPKGPIGDAERVIIICIRGGKKWILLHLF